MKIERPPLIQPNQTREPVQGQPIAGGGRMMHSGDDRPLRQPNQTREPAQGQPIGLEFLFNAYQFLMSIKEPRSEAIQKSIDHLEGQISKVILSINLRIGP
jgi:hypothetical protein